MPVQKSRKTPSARGMHRSHDGLTKPALSIDPQSGETHLRHRITPDEITRSWIGPPPGLEGNSDGLGASSNYASSIDIS